jgi:hypothetical protein
VESIILNGKSTIYTPLFVGFYKKHFIIFYLKSQAKGVELCQRSKFSGGSKWKA